MKCAIENCDNEATTQQYLSSGIIVWVCHHHHNLLHSIKNHTGKLLSTIKLNKKEFKKEKVIFT